MWPVAHTNLFDRGDPLPWPRRGHERAGRGTTGGHAGELVDESGAESEEDAPRCLRWHRRAAGTWDGGGACAKRPSARPSQSNEEEVRAWREGGHGRGDGQTAAVRRGARRGAAMYGLCCWCAQERRVVAPRASQRRLCPWKWMGVGLARSLAAVEVCRVGLSLCQLPCDYAF